MAIGDAYATAAQYKAQTGKETSADDTPLGIELLAVSRYLERALGRVLGFNKDAANVARVYVMGRGTRIDIDDHVSVASVAIGDHYTGVYDSNLAATAYVLLPRNAATGPESRPYRQIEFLADQPGVGELVKVTGVGGWTAVPSAIVAATIELCSILRLESPRAANRINEMNQVLSTSRAAQNIVGELTAAYRSVSGIFA